MNSHRMNVISQVLCCDSLVYVVELGLVFTMPLREFEKGGHGFTLKTLQTFSVHATQKKTT